MAESQHYSASFRSAWGFTRSLTCDLLAEMNTDELLFTPGAGMGAFWKQFRHVGRVQECYMEALTTHEIIFTPDGKSYDKGPSKPWLVAYLKRLDEGMDELLDGVDWTAEIDWYGEKVKVFEHMMRLESHETLHHGQWIVYMQMAGMKFPDSWKVWGL